MLVLWRAGDENIQGYIQGLATSYESARAQVEGIPDVFAAEYEVDWCYRKAEAPEDFDDTPWTRLTDSFGTWVQF